MMRRSAETVILADHSKFDRPSLAVYGQWSKAVTLVSDAAPTGELAEALVAAGARLLTPQTAV
jgi:DeoR/GlpR family transcriptional regulator of sugar metabolism